MGSLLCEVYFGGGFHSLASDIVLFHCWDELIVVSGSLLRPVSLLTRDHC